MPYNSSWKTWHIDLKVMFWLQIVHSIVHASLGVELNGLDRLDGLLFYNAAGARDFRMEALLAAFKGFQRAC